MQALAKVLFNAEYDSERDLLRHANSTRAEDAGPRCGAHLGVDGAAEIRRRAAAALSNIEVGAGAAEAAQAGLGRFRMCPSIPSASSQ